MTKLMNNHKPKRKTSRKPKRKFSMKSLRNIAANSLDEYNFVMLHVPSDDGRVNPVAKNLQKIVIEERPKVSVADLKKVQLGMKIRKEILNFIVLVFLIVYRTLSDILDPL